MLGQTNDSITSIAVQSGFGSIATFNRAFQKYEGMSPTEYRRMKQEALSLNEYNDLVAKGKQLEKEREAQQND